MTVKFETPLGPIRFSLFGQNGNPINLNSYLSSKLVGITHPKGRLVEECRLITIKLDGDFVTTPTKCCATVPQDLNSGEFGPEPGENFDSVVLNKSGFSVCLGTRDGCALNYIVPERLRIAKGEFLPWINYSNRGILIEIPQLKNHEEIEIYFSIAWKKIIKHDDIDVWLAAEIALP